MWTQVPSNAAADRELGSPGSLKQLSGFNRPSRWRDPNFWIQIALFVVAAVFLALFVVYAVRNGEARSCRLTYSDDAAVSEAQMRDWAADAGWPLTHPTWSNDLKACVCDADPTPSLAPGTRKTPAWIAPGDVASLYPDGAFPVGFSRDAYAPTDHVKVCLESAKLAQLWTGLDASGNRSSSKHCHNPHPFQIYTGWDGDLYCSDNLACDNPPSSVADCTNPRSFYCVPSIILDDTCPLCIGAAIANGLGYSCTENKNQGG